MIGPMFEEPGIRAIMDRFVANLPNTFRPIFAKQLPRIFDATAIAYTREFTLEELQDIARFAQTPNGARYFVNLQKLQSDPAVTAAVRRLGAEGRTVFVCGNGGSASTAAERNSRWNWRKKATT